jgi:hypothetical protein
MLIHRSGTDFEDMYWFDGSTGKEFTSITDMSIPSVVKYSPDFMKKYQDIKNKVTIHNHPRSMPPSIGDFESAYRNGYSLGVVVTHDGTVYIYGNFTVPSTEIYNTLVDTFKSMNFSEFTSEKKALEEMADRGIIVYKEVN